MTLLVVCVTGRTPRQQKHMPLFTKCSLPKQTEEETQANRTRAPLIHPFSLSFVIFLTLLMPSPVAMQPLKYGAFGNAFSGCKNSSDKS